MPKLRKKRSVKKHRPCLFVDFVDIRPRQKQYPSAYDPVLVVSHLSIPTEQTLEEIISPMPCPKPQNYFISHAYNKANLAKTAIQYFFQTAAVYTYKVPTPDIDVSVSQGIAADILPVPNIGNYSYREEVGSPELTNRRSNANIFRKIRHRIIVALLDQLQR